MLFASGDAPISPPAEGRALIIREWLFCTALGIGKSEREVSPLSFFGESFRQGDQSLSLSFDFVDILNYCSLDRAVASNDWRPKQGDPNLCAIRMQAECIFRARVLSAK